MLEMLRLTLNTQPISWLFPLSSEDSAHHLPMGLMKSLPHGKQVWSLYLRNVETDDDWYHRGSNRTQEDYDGS